MNPTDRTWFDRIGIPAQARPSARYVYAIEPALDTDETAVVPSTESPNAQEESA